MTIRIYADTRFEYGFYTPVKQKIMLSLSRRYFLTFEHLAKCTRCLTGNRRYPGKSRLRDKSGGVEEALLGSFGRDPKTSKTTVSREQWE